MRNFHLFLILLLATACTERMDITTDNAASRIAITGCVTTNAMPHAISIVQTMGYFGHEELKTYSDATVKINNELLTSVGKGVYVTDSSFFGVPGQTDKLDVELRNEAGITEHYTAETTMPTMHVLDSAVLYATPFFGEAFPMFVYFQDLPGPNTFGAHLYINNLQYTNKIQRYYLNNFDDYTAEGQYIRFPIFFISKEMRWDNEEHIYIYAGDTLTFELNALSGEYYDFIHAAKQEINGGNPLFAGPPANVPGNISGGALGIFGSYTISRDTVIIDEKYEFPERPAETL
jgi:hypothetical protein